MEPEKKYKSYLPSKYFIIRGSIAFATIILILVFQTNWFKSLFIKNPNQENQTPTTQTVGDLLIKDTNGNGIADWEEKLWGLDPSVLYTNGVSNKQIIEQKKKSLGINDTNQSSLNDADLLAQQIFSISAAVGQSGQLDISTLASIGTDIGNSVKFKQISNKYSLKDIKTTTTTTASLKAYYGSVAKIINKYEENITDIDIIVAAFETGDFSNLQKLKEISSQYITLSKSLQTLTVPIGIAGEHLSLINSLHGMAMSFDYILQIEEDGISGISGIAIYKNYSLKFEESISDLNDYFVNYGIINE
jgi:hypothetical protein